MSREKAIELYQEYVKLLEDEIDEIVGYAYTHGWRSTRGDKGKELRSSIEHELLESEPPAGEFTKRARDYYKNIDSQTPFLLEACDRIDKLETENISLLAADVVNKDTIKMNFSTIDKLKDKLTAKDELLKKSRDYIRTQNHVGGAQMQFIKEIEQALKGNDG